MTRRWTRSNSSGLPTLLGAEAVQTRLLAALVEWVLVDDLFCPALLNLDIRAAANACFASGLRCPRRAFWPPKFHFFNIQALASVILDIILFTADVNRFVMA